MASVHQAHKETLSPSDGNKTFAPRCLRNHPELRDALASRYNLPVVEFPGDEPQSLRDNLLLWHRARLVIAPHGMVVIKLASHIYDW